MATDGQAYSLSYASRAEPSNSSVNPGTCYFTETTTSPTVLCRDTTPGSSVTHAAVLLNALPALKALS
jgi:hypothetical protein